MFTTEYDTLKVAAAAAAESDVHAWLDADQLHQSVLLLYVTEAAYSTTSPDRLQSPE